MTFITTECPELPKVFVGLHPTLLMLPVVVSSMATPKSFLPCCSVSCLSCLSYVCRPLLLSAGTGRCPAMLHATSSMTNITLNFPFMSEYLEMPENKVYNYYAGSSSDSFQPIVQSHERTYCCGTPYCCGSSHSLDRSTFLEDDSCSEESHSACYLSDDSGRVGTWQLHDAEQCAPQRDERQSPCPNVLVAVFPLKSETSPEDN